MDVRGPALALLELDSIARGIVAGDAIVKRAPVQIAMAEPTTPGKYLLLFSGGVAEVEESLKAGLETAGSSLLDKLLLPQASLGLLEALRGKFYQEFGESFGMIETHSVASTLLAADTALKRADVKLRRMHLARGIGGKGYFVLTGPLHMVQAAVEAAGASIEPRLLLATEIIQRPHPDAKGTVL